MKDISFKFIDYKLTRLNYSLRSTSDDGDQEQLIQPLFKGRFQREDEKSLSTFLSVKIEAAHLPFVLDVEIVGLFELNNGDIAEDKLEKLATINLSAVLFPFLRELIADCTRRAGFPPLLLPSVNFVKIFEESIKNRNSGLTNGETDPAVVS